MAASISIVEETPCAVWLKDCFSRLRPPKNMAQPVTSSTLPMMAPVTEALTTSNRPAWMAKTAMISSVALPNVAFNRPPTPAPTCFEISSVPLPMKPASGTMASPADRNTSIGSTRNRSSTMLKGIKRSITDKARSKLSLNIAGK